jgi:hypothetical protein
MAKLAPSTIASFVSIAIQNLLKSTKRRSVTVFIDSKRRVTAARMLRPSGNTRTETIAVTYGRLNWASRVHLKSRRRRNLLLTTPQIRHWPKVR